MARKISSSSLTRANKRLALENAALSKKINGTERTMENSLSGLVDGLGANQFGGGQAPITSLNPSFQNSMYSPITLMWSNLMYMYRSHGLLQSAIDVPVLDAIRGGIELSSDQLDQDEISQIEDFLEENAVLDRIADAFIWARLFGGAALVINTEADSEQPLGDELHGGRLEFYDAARWELTCERRIPASGKYGFYGKTLDASRVLTILGKRAPFTLRAQLSDWGVSEIERMIEDFNLFLRGRNVAYEILEECKIDVYQFEGFAAQLATANGTGMTTRRVQAMNALKNFNNALILDKKDSYEQKTFTFSGLSEILKENRVLICAALRMPMTKLFGTEASGLNSGQGDLENYVSLVESEVRSPMKQVMRKVLKVIVQNLFHEDLDIRFKFKPLRILSAGDEELIKTSKTARYTSLYDKLIINSRELGEILHKEELVPIKIDAEQGLLDDHPVQAAGQPNTGELGAAPVTSPPAKDEKLEVPKIPEKNESDIKIQKAEKAEKAEKANTQSATARRILK